MNNKISALALMSLSSIFGGCASTLDSIENFNTPDYRTLIINNHPEIFGYPSKDSTKASCVVKWPDHDYNEIFNLPWCQNKISDFERIVTPATHHLLEDTVNFILKR